MQLEFSDLTADEQSVLQQTYGLQIKSATGYSPYRIEAIYELTENEATFFDRKNFVSPYFFVQTLYKVKGVLTPMRFNLALNKSMQGDEALRANYCNVGNRVLRVVFAGRPTPPEIVFRNLSHLDAEDLDDRLKKIMEADMRQGFDLRSGNLIRFAAFRTADDECAVLVTAAYLIEHHLDIPAMIANISGDFVAPAKKAAGIIPPITKAMHDYWENILADVPPMPKVPGSQKSWQRYKQNAYRFAVPPDIMADLWGKAKNNQLLLMAILQIAWVLMLQTAQRQNDIALCLLMPERGANDNSPVANANIIPTRLALPDDLPLRKIVAQQFKQLLVAKSYSCFNWQSLQSVTGNRGKLFDHFLSFLDFSDKSTSYSAATAAPQGQVVSRTSWDAQGMSLGVYFNLIGRKLSVSFLYNENDFVPDIGESLAKLYKLALQQLIFDWDSPFADSANRFVGRLAQEREMEKAERKESKMDIIDFISQLSVFHGDEGNIELIAPKSRAIVCFEGDRISGDTLEENLVFVMHGKLSRSMDTGDGWYMALDIIKENGWLNETVLLPSHKSKISAEVLTEKAMLLALPLANFKSLFRNHPDIAENIMGHVLAQMEKFQRLWLQS